MAARDDQGVAGLYRECIPNEQAYIVAAHDALGRETTEGTGHLC